MKSKKANIDPELLEIGYWILPILLFVLQAIFTFSSFNQIRYEELAESIRNVFWLEKGLVYDGVSSNLGWYLPLLGIYKLFGFSLFAAKYLRLGIAFFSLLSLAAVFKKLLGLKAWLPLLVIGLSPTLIFFSCLEAQFGIELQVLPILIWLLLYVSPQKTWQSVLALLGIGVIAMITWLSYPAFIIYIPVLGFWIVYRLGQKKLVQLSALVIGGLIPFLLAISLVTNKNVLWHDPKTGGGLFRGAGQLSFSLTHIWNNVIGLISDLLSKGTSYYYEVAAGDFSYLFPLVSLGFVTYTCYQVWQQKDKKRLIIFSAIIVMVLSLFLSSMTSDPSGLPGMRRNTGVLVGIYTLFTLIWDWIFNKKWVDRQVKQIVIGVCILLLVHHGLAYIVNISSLSKPSLFQAGLWFGIYENPQKSIDFWATKAQKEPLELACKNEAGENVYCRYPEIYATLAGSCEWNKLNCREIYGFDNKTQKFIPLSVELWRDYYWEH
ncbi:hypothetical protein GYA49_02240 [Candidatus Beckwithbacteria bacterium]|nr:hypothetical protein [Candidatus Beckwithbacteria bacterium]